MAVPFGFSVGDFVTLGHLAFRVYRSYQDAPATFSEVSEQIKILHINLKEVADRLEDDDRRILPSQRAAMQEIATSCQSTLDRLEGIISQYSAMDMKRQLTWERLRWQAEDQLQIKQDLTVKLIALSNLNQSLSGSSTTKLLLNLQRLVTQAIATRKQGTIVSALTSTDMREDHLWASIGRDLQVAGISREMVTANRDVIREQVEYLFGSGLMTSDNVSEDADSPWQDSLISRATSRAISGLPASPNSGAHQQSFHNNQFHLEDQKVSLLEKSRWRPMDRAQHPPTRSRSTGRQMDELPQCPWQKLSSDQLPLTNDDATYRPYVVEIKLVTPPSKCTTHEIDGFSFKPNYVSEHSWVFLRLSQHTRDGIRSLSTPDPYNPVQDHGRQFSQKWTELAFSRAFREWSHVLLKPDQPIYVCVPGLLESLLGTLAKDNTLAFPVAFSFDLDTDAIVFWKLSRRLPGSFVPQYRAKSMDEVPNKGLLQYVKRMSLRKQAKRLNLDSAQGQGQILIMLFTQKVIDKSRAWANTWIMEQELSSKHFGASSGPYSSYSDSVKLPSTFVDSNGSDVPKGSMPYVHPPSINVQSESLLYLAKASAVCAFEASLPDELSFAVGDEIWITQYVESEMWEGINQRTRQKGMFPNTLVKIFLVKRMPSRKKMPLEMGGSVDGFVGSPIEKTFLSPGGIDGRDAPFPSRGGRSASTSDIPSTASASGSSTRVIAELDSTSIPSIASEHAPSVNQRVQVARVTSSASDDGPRRAVSQSHSLTLQDLASPYFDKTNQAPPGRLDINRPQFLQSWAPTPESTITRAEFGEYFVSRAATPSGTMAFGQPYNDFDVSAYISPENKSESTQAAANNLRLLSDIPTSHQTREAAEEEAIPMSGSNSLRKATKSNAPPANASSSPVSSPQLYISTDDTPIDPMASRPGTETPLISGDVEQKIFSLSLSANQVVQSQLSSESLTTITTNSSSIPAYVEPSGGAATRVGVSSAAGSFT